MSSIHITFWVNKKMGEIGAPGSNVLLGFVEADSAGADTVLPILAAGNPTFGVDYLIEWILSNSICGKSFEGVFHDGDMTDMPSSPQTQFSCT